MKRLMFPLVAVLAALWATVSMVRTHPRREATEPPIAPPMSSFPNTLAAVGLVEASTENISVGSPLGAVVTRVFVNAGRMVKAGEPLFQLDVRHLEADLAVRQAELSVARSRTGVVEAQLADLKQQLDFAEEVKDKRAISAEDVSRRRFAVQTAAAELDEARTQVTAAEARIHDVATEIERSTVRAPIDAEVLQVRLRVGEFAPAAPTGAAPMMVLGRSKPLHVRVDVDENEAWRLRPEAAAIGHVRGNAELKTPLRFVRLEPYVVPKRSLTGDSTERVDTRVLQVIYRVENEDLPLLVGQQMDVFIDGGRQIGGQP
jgi:HlyD family secretion protein